MALNPAYIGKRVLRGQIIGDGMWDGLVSEDDPNHEYLTDLLTVFLGFGVFSANSVIREGMGQDGAFSSWRKSHTQAPCCA